MHADAHRAQRRLAAISAELAWELLRAVAAHASRGAPITAPVGLGWLERGGLVLGGGGAPLIYARPELERAWSPAAPVSALARRLFDRYMPLCVGEWSSDLVVAHLGQSLDHRIAAEGGLSLMITGADDVRHTHCLRALFDAVIVGAHTVASDDPRLTTRLVRGSSPTRVILDPRQRLSAQHRVFHDRAAPTLRVVGDRAAGSHLDAEATLAIPERDGELDLRALLVELSRRGLRRVFIEGGGVTVGHFLRARLLDRLQLVVAPVTLGAGPPGICRDGVLAHLFDGVPCRRERLGDDSLFEWTLERARPSAEP